MNPTILPSSTQFWTWQNQSIRYQHSGSQGPALVLLHGFGASSDHWRKNLPDLGHTHRVYALDLLGYGRSAKPAPGDPLDYTFETWGQQVNDFCREVVGGPAFLVGNSIGAVVALQAAVAEPTLALGVILINCSLRLLHERKQRQKPWYQRTPTPLVQWTLRHTPLGQLFFQQLAQPQAVTRILRQAYGRTEAVTPELVQLLLEPALEPGALAVFLAFIQYSYGPLAEDLLPQLACPAWILWGEADPWEPIALGRELANYPAVQAFETLPGLGHCPQDEAPEEVNPRIRDWTLSVGISGLGAPSWIG